MSKNKPAKTKQETPQPNPDLKKFEKSNPSLSSFNVLVGDWNTVGTHPAISGTLPGRASFEWFEGGAFLFMRSEIDEPRFPKTVAIFGGDGTKGEYFMLSFDERGVARKYDVTFENTVLKWWRNAPEFSQRYTHTIVDDGNTIIGKGELSKDGSTWEKDLDLTYTRVK